MKTFRITKDGTEPQDFTRDWVQAWGAGRELLAIFGTNKTVLPEPSSDLSGMTPGSFQLNETCEAALAGPRGSGLGAIVSQVGPTRQTPVKGTPPTKEPTSPKNAVPNF
jgi:hypothetical protein